MVLAFALADLTGDTCFGVIVYHGHGPRAPKRTNGLNAAYVISKQRLYCLDLVLTLSLCVRLIWPGQCIRIRRKTTGGRGPSILHRTRRSRQNLRGNSVDASNPLRASLQVHLCLRHAKPVDAMVSVQILFHALSCHKYPASLRSPRPSFIRFTVGCTSVSKRNSLDISFFDISSL